MFHVVQGIAKIQAFGQKEEKVQINPVLHGSFLFTNFQFSELKDYSLSIIQTPLLFCCKIRKCLFETKLAGTHILIEGKLWLNEDWKTMNWSRIHDGYLDGRRTGGRNLGKY